MKRGIQRVLELRPHRCRYKLSRSFVREKRRVKWFDRAITDLGSFEFRLADLQIGSGHRFREGHEGGGFREVTGHMNLRGAREEQSKDPVP